MKMFHSTLFFSEYVGRHNTVLLVNVVQENRPETPFKADNVKSLIKSSNCEKLVLYFSKKIQKIAEFAMLFLVSVTQQSLENVLASHNGQKYPRYPLIIKFKSF